MAAIFTTPKFSPTPTASISTSSHKLNPKTSHHSLLNVSSKPAHPPFPYTSARRTSVSCSHPQQTPTTTTRRRPDYIPNRIPDPSYVRIFDTTLRDGEQSPGASLTSKEKLDIARQLARLGVDIIEAGFPAASKDDFEAVKAIATDVGNAVDKDGYVPVICGLSRCNEKDIRTAWEAVKYAKRPRIHTFIATSAIHMEYKLRKTKEEVIEIARSMVRFARSLGCEDVEFSPEDAGRFACFDSWPLLSVCHRVSKTIWHIFCLSLSSKKLDEFLTFGTNTSLCWVSGHTWNHCGETWMMEFEFISWSAIGYIIYLSCEIIVLGQKLFLNFYWSRFSLILRMHYSSLDAIQDQMLLNNPVLAPK